MEGMQSLMDPYCHDNICRVTRHCLHGKESYRTSCSEVAVAASAASLEGLILATNFCAVVDAKVNIIDEVYIRCFPDYVSVTLTRLYVVLDLSELPSVYVSAYDRKHYLQVSCNDE
jgi:hypothetical protein